jgi:hypothetical protein
MISVVTRASRLSALALFKLLSELFTLLGQREPLLFQFGVFGF